MNQKVPASLPKQFYVSITGLRPISKVATIFFWLHAIPSKMQADRAEGILYSGVKRINGIQHTLTAWKSKEDMKAYVTSGAHLKAMRAFPKIATGKTFGYLTSSLPSWEEVHHLWLTQANDYQGGNLKSN